MAPTVATFREFWPHYVLQHKNPWTRRIHFAATAGAAACLVGGVVFRSKWLLLAAPVVGYVPSELSHFLIERNIPATFSHPLWALWGDLVMCSRMAKGTMDATVERVLAKQRERETAEAPAAVSSAAS
jgi:hypothetical protein